MKHWNRVSREAVDAPTLEVFKPRLEMPWETWSRQGSRSQVIFKVPCNPNHCTVLCVQCFFSLLYAFVRQTLKKLKAKKFILGLLSYRHLILGTSNAKFEHTGLCYISIGVEISNTPWIASMQLLRRKCNFSPLPCSKQLCSKLMVYSL